MQLTKDNKEYIVTCKRAYDKYSNEYSDLYRLFTLTKASNDSKLKRELRDKIASYDEVYKNKHNKIKFRKCYHELNVDFYYNKLTRLEERLYEIKDAMKILFDNKSNVITDSFDKLIKQVKQFKSKLN